MQRGGGRGGFRGGRGGDRGRSGGRGFGGGRGGGRGGWVDYGPPDTVVEAGVFEHPCEGEAVCKLSNDKVPYFNAPIFLQNKTQIGKIEEIFGSITVPYFTVKMQEGVVATSYASGDKFYIDPMKLLPMERFLPQPKGAPTRGGGRGGRGGRGGARGARGGGGRFGVRGGGVGGGRGGGRFGGRGGGGGGFGGRGGGGIGGRSGGFGGRGGGGRGRGRY
ncbi:hypothetical protein WJX81_003877 [Elliptochloris bilobata]|uniref:H/ACA ribonucleoprotein complex subunit n=1 Tax=Elliptochloris bilobata TaxID=381761 RepID=A0AAW1RVI2_9CHLO